MQERMMHSKRSGLFLPEMAVRGQELAAKHRQQLSQQDQAIAALKTKSAMRIIPQMTLAELPDGHLCLAFLSEGIGYRFAEEKQMDQFISVLQERLDAVRRQRDARDSEHPSSGTDTPEGDD